MKEAKVVQITPILSYSATGQMIGEIGAGGGGGDLLQLQDFELSDQDISDLQQWCEDEVIDPSKRQTTFNDIAQIKVAEIRSFPSAALGDDDYEYLDKLELLKRLARFVRRSLSGVRINEASAMEAKAASERKMSRNIVSCPSDKASNESILRVLVFPLFQALLLRRALPPCRRIQTTRCLSLHC